VLEIAIEAARAAGRVALQHFTGTFHVERKADMSPVTEADRRAEETIVSMLRSAFPDFGFLGEEYGSQGPQDGTRWIIDPIDGTRNFVRGIPFWATLLALEESGEVTLDVIHAAATGELFYARKGEGAFADGKRLRVSDVDRLDQAFLVHGSLNLLHQTAQWDGFIRLADATERQRGYGDYHAYTFIARGQAELCVEVDVKPWDLAAIKIVTEEAGGRFTDLEGTPTIYSGNALVSNGRLHDQALALLRGQPLPETR
jgi:histidinol-phosphatase